jgi:glycosyltransferase involved in cell wall biosynthesis
MCEFWTEYVIRLLKNGFRYVVPDEIHLSEDMAFKAHSMISPAMTREFLMPSYAETFGLVILEALSCGLPVIARDIPEFHDIFGDRILYFRTREEIAAILDDGQRLSASASGAREFTGQYDIRDIAQRHIALYHELVDV